MGDLSKKAGGENTDSENKAGALCADNEVKAEALCADSESKASNSTDVNMWYPLEFLMVLEFQYSPRKEIILKKILSRSIVRKKVENSDLK
jgi:hypothetical protein